MFEFEQFERLNRSHWSEGEMRRNYEIAIKVEERYYADPDDAAVIHK